MAASFKHGKMSHRLRSYFAAVKQDPCAYCGSMAAGTLDHIHPKINGGNGNWQNAAGSCVACNRLKDSLSVLQFLARRYGHHE